MNFVETLSAPAKKAWRNRERIATVFCREALLPFTQAWHYRELIRAVVRRELTSRFRDSLLGWVWAIFAPLAMLYGYIVIFSFAAPGLSEQMSTQTYAANVFCGLILFNTFAELAARAPTLMHEHENLIKKSIFPSETLAWTATIRAFVYGAISFMTLLAVLVINNHSLYATALLTPLIIIPYMLLILGMVWFLMALGAFTKDVSHLMVAIVPLLMFATPVFFQASMLSPTAQTFLRLNLVGNYIEMLRDLVIRGSMPNPLLFIGTFIASYAIFLYGYRFFNHYKSVIVDVI